MKHFITLLLLISCSHTERRISSTEEHQDQLRTLFEATPTEPLLDRHEFQRYQRKAHHYVCKGKSDFALATEPVGVQAAFSIKNKFESCRIISQAEYKNHQN